MAEIKNEILQIIFKMIGNPGQSISQTTILEDSTVTQTMPIVPEIARRSLVEGNSTGWFEGVMQNTHGAADDEESQIDPYRPGVNAVAPYPRVVPSAWDLWLLFVGGRQISGGGTLTGAVLGINPDNVSQGWGITDAPAPLVTTPTVQLAAFDSISTLAAGIGFSPMMTEQGLVLQPVGMRIARGSIFTFNSTSTGSAVFQMYMVMGLFPASLGQDVAS